MYYRVMVDLAGVIPVVIQELGQVTLISAFMDIQAGAVAGEATAVTQAMVTAAVYYNLNQSSKQVGSQG